MNNESDIRKEFNDMFANNNQESVQPYRATQNFNQVNEQQFVNANNNINNNMNNNINNVSNFQQMNLNNMVQNNNHVVNNVYDNNTQMISNTENISVLSSNGGNNNVDYQNTVLYDTTTSINNAQNTNQNIVKKKKATIKINPELKGIFILVIVLLISMALIPSLFDLIDDIKLKIFG